MKRNLLTFLLLTGCFFAQAQSTAKPLADKQINMAFGRAIHGTGDLRGLQFSVEYGRYVRKKWKASAGVSSTIHSGSYPLVLHGNEPVDASFRYTTAGLQLEGAIGYTPLRSRNHELLIAAGPVLRYQSSSLPDQYGLNFPPSINFPEPVFTFRNFTKQNTYTAGYAVSLSYQFTLDNGYLLGLKGGFQNDTNGDLIRHTSLQLGKRF